MTIVSFKRQIPWLENLHHIGNEVMVVLHSDDGLSVPVPRSLLVASSDLLKQLLRDRCGHVDIHVSLAGVEADTLSFFLELLRSGKVQRVVDGNINNNIKSKVASLLRSISSSLGLVSQDHSQDNQTDENHNNKAKSKDRQQVSTINLKKRRTSLAGPRSKVHKKNVDVFNESNAEIMQVFKEIVPREVPHSFVDSGIATSTPKTSPVRPSTSAHVDKGKSKSLINRKDTNVGASSNVESLKAEVIDKEYDDILNKGLNEAGYDSRNGVECVAFVCPFCRKEFRRQHALKDHVNRFHPEPGKNQATYECRECNRKFTNNGGLLAHKRYKHQNKNIEGPKKSSRQISKSRSNNLKSKSKDESGPKTKTRDSTSSMFSPTISSTSKAKSKTAKKVCSEFNNETKPQNATNDVTADHEKQLTYHCDDCSQIYTEADKEDHVVKTGHRAFTKFRAPRLPRIEF